MMERTKAWEAFFSTGQVCDYLQYAAESRQTKPMQNELLQQNNDGKETNAPCSVSRTE